jgi:hypothetical protein
MKIKTKNELKTRFFLIEKNRILLINKQNLI